MCPDEGGLYDRVKLGDFWGRFSVGISLKGEIKMPGYSAFLNLGYDVIHAKESDVRWYQIFGVKVYLKDDGGGTFGRCATESGKTQYILQNLGYTRSTVTKNEMYNVINIRK